MLIKNKIEKRSILNLLSGLGYQAISMGLGLLLPYLYITNLGSESNGLLSSVGQVFLCLGLLEAGVGTATIQALYKPISKNNKNNVSEILAATDEYYRKTGRLYTLAIFVLVLIYPLFIDSSIPKSTIRIVIATQGIGGVFSYFFQAKYTLLLRAEGRNYVIKTVSFVTLFLRNFGKIFVLKVGWGLIAVQVIQLITILIEGIYVICYIKKHYPWINLKLSPAYDAISQKNSVLLQSIAWMVFNHTDILVLTVFSRDLALVSVYSVYVLLYEAGQNITNEIRESFQYKIGKLVQQDTKRFADYFSIYSIIVLTISFSVFTTLYFVTTPFVTLYTADVSDINYVLRYVPELFFFYKILYSIRALNKQIIEANGHFRQTSFIPIIESCMNISLSIILVRNYGIVGVLIGTVLSLLAGDFLYMNYIRKVVRNVVFYEFLYILLCLPIVVLIVCSKLKIIMPIDTWIKLMGSGILIGILSMLVFGIILIGISINIYRNRIRQNTL